MESFKILSQQTGAVNVMIDGVEYMYYLDDIFIDDIMRHYNNGRYGYALRDLKNFSYEDRFYEQTQTDTD